MSVGRPWIAYVGPMAFPEGGAAAQRILGNALALVEAEYNVVIVSGQAPGSEGADFEVAQGIRCVSVNERDAEYLTKTLRYARYALMGARSRHWLEAQATPPAAVILYSGYTPYLLQLAGWAKRRKLPILFDAVEWYTAPSFWQFLASPYLWNTEFAMRVLIPRCDAVITISRALDRYYVRRGLTTCRVPPLFNPKSFQALEPRPALQGCLRLAYAGSPGRKDLLDTVIEAVIAVDGGTKQLVLDIAGVTSDELSKRAPIRARAGVIPDCIRAHGRLPHAAATKLVRQADFVVFLRNINRVSTHGFPTKFVESLALGTPVITNLTSNLSDHLRDGETGLICPQPNAGALEATLRQALALSSDQLYSLRRSAIKEAHHAFNYQHYSAQLRTFIDALTDASDISAQVTLC